MTIKSKSKPWEPCVDISILVGSLGETKQPTRKLVRLHNAPWGDNLPKVPKNN